MAKNDWYLVNGVDVRKFQTHNSIESLNITVNYAVYEYSAYLTKSTIRVLRYISQFAIHAYGVAWRGIEGIANALDINERTVRRALKTLDKLGIINRVKTRKWNGDRGVDILVIKRLNTGKATVSCSEMSTECPTNVHEMSGESINAVKTTDNNDDDKNSMSSLEEIFTKEADDAGLPMEQRQTILERIQRYVPGIGSLVPYIRKVIQTALNAMKNTANQSESTNTSDIHNIPQRKNYVAKNNRKTSVTSKHNAVSFEQAVKEQLRRKKLDKRVRPVPVELARAQARDKAEYDRIQAEEKANRDTIPVDVRKARILAMLGRV